MAASNKGMKQTSVEHTAYLYVDESIHAVHDLIIVSFVYAATDPGPEVAAALSAHGLTPGIDEFKSSSPMHGQLDIQALREALFVVLGQCRVGLCATAASERPNLGILAIQGLEALVQRNRDLSAPMTVSFDQGIPPGRVALSAFAAGLPALAHCTWQFEQDSKAVMGLQLADLAASTCAQIVTQRLRPVPKTVPGDVVGYSPEDRPELWWVLKMRNRYVFFAGSDPLPQREVGPDDDPDTSWPMADVYSTAVWVSPGLDPQLDAHLYEVFQVWYGCFH
jgi:hypothetical protein